MVLIFIHSFVSVSSFTCLLYFIFCGTNWAEQEQSPDTGPQHLVIFWMYLFLGKGNALWTGPEGTFSGIFRFVYLLFPQHCWSLHFASLQHSGLYCLCHHSYLCDSVSDFCPPHSLGLSNASSLLFIMQGQARVTCLRALNFEWQCQSRKTFASQHISAVNYLTSKSTQMSFSQRKLLW